MTTNQHRVFLAINLPDRTVKRLAEFRKEWFDLPIRLTKIDNLHITLIFLGYISSEEIFEISNLAKKAISKESVFEIKLNKICFGPSNEKPRMIWAKGEASEKLNNLKNSLEANLFDLNRNVGDRNKSFSPHITMARIKQKEWGGLLNNPSVEKDISLTFSVDSVEIMESFLSRKGPEYIILESIPLK